jgi:hypothetical protein
MNCLVFCLFVGLMMLGCGVKQNKVFSQEDINPTDTQNDEKVDLKDSITRIDDWVLRDWGVDQLEDLRPIAKKLTPKQRMMVKEVIIEQGQRIKSLDGVEVFPNLDYLNIREAKLSTIAGLGQNQKLQHLYLTRAHIQNTSGIAQVQYLLTLGLSGCPLTDVGDLQKLSKLRSLSLDSTLIKGLNGESLPKSINYLGLRETKITSLAAIESTFGFVEKIDLTASAIETIDDVKNFGAVKAIGLYMTPVMKKFADGQGNVPQYVDYKGVRLLFVEPEF